MKILMIAPEPFFEPRGTPISVHQRLETLSALGHRVDLLTYHLGQDVDIPGVTIHRIPQVPFIKEVNIGPSWAKLFLDLLLFGKAIHMLTTKRYDVIHSHEEASFFCIALAAIFHTAHLYDMHSSLPLQLGNFKGWHYWPFVKLFTKLERRVLTTCDAVIIIDANLDAHVRAVNPSIKTIVIENLAVNLNGFLPTPQVIDALKEGLGLNNSLPVVYTGSFESYQALDLLLESAKIVREHFPEVTFVFVGGKPKQVKFWQNQAKGNCLEDCTVFVGSVPLQEVSSYLKMAKILVSPRTEGTSVPLKIYSYLHSGKAIVATNSSAHTQVLNDDIALLVEPTKDALAEGILKLARNPDLRANLGQQARTFAIKRFNPEEYLAKVEKIYQFLDPSTSTAERVASSPKPSSPSLKAES